ncbi:MAG TPA: hypothetical protein VD905_12480 [Flavobacteriales bacterium]|nr:hypothetical protein [Flavobacteriales bacterium]
MKKVINLFLITTALVIFSCNKEKEQNAIFTYRAVDGCSWLIQLPNGNLLEPVNLSDFNVTPYEGKKISIRYKVSDGASICMMGELVKLTSLKEK